MFKIFFPNAGRRVGLIERFLSVMDDNDRIYIHNNFDDAATKEVFKDCFQCYNLNNWLKYNEFDIAIPTLDTDLARFESENYFNNNNKYLVSKNSKFYNNKTLTYLILNNLGLPTPRVAYINTTDFSKKCIFKPAMGAGSKGIFFSDEKNYHEIYDYVKTLDEDYIIQELANGSEYTVDCFADLEGTLINAVQRKRDFVRSGEVAISTTKKIEKIQEIIENLFAKIKFCGPITVQIFYNEEKKEVQIIEINPRFGGGYILSDEAIMKNNSKDTYPKLIIDMYNGKKLKPQMFNYKENLCMTRYDEEMFFERI